MVACSTTKQSFSEKQSRQVCSNRRCFPLSHPIGSISSFLAGLSALRSSRQGDLARAFLAVPKQLGHAARDALRDYAKTMTMFRKKKKNWEEQPSAWLGLMSSTRCADQACPGGNANFKGMGQELLTTKTDMLGPWLVYLWRAATASQCIHNREWLISFAWCVTA